MNKLRILSAMTLSTLSLFSQADDLENIYPILKDFNWIAKPQAVNQSFLGIDQAPVPLIAYGFETKRNYQFLSNDVLNDTNLASLHDNAIANLCKKESKFDELFTFGLTASGNSFSSEMILCDNFLLTAEQKLGTDEILVSMPRRTVIYVAKKSMTEKESKQFFYLVSYTYKDNTINNAPITNLVFEYKGTKNTSIFKVE